MIEREGRFLLTRRLEGTHLAGCWEFPGGKCEAGEDHAACLARELREELGVGCAVGSHVLSTVYEYPERTVTLHFYRCALDGPPAALLGQQMRWVAREELRGIELPPADGELVEVLEAGG